MTEKQSWLVSLFSSWTHQSSITILRTTYSGFTSQRYLYIICRVYMPEPLQLNAPVLVFWISILNYFLSSLTCLLWSGTMTFGSLEVKKRIAAVVWLVLVNVIQFPQVFHLIAVILRLGRVLLEMKDALMSQTVVTSSLLKSGDGVKLKIIARHIRWWVLFRLVRALS